MTLKEALDKHKEFLVTEEMNQLAEESDCEKRADWVKALTAKVKASTFFEAQKNLNQLLRQVDHD